LEKEKCARVVAELAAEKEKSASVEAQLQLHLLHELKSQWEATAAEASSLRTELQRRAEEQEGARRQAELREQNLQ
jgi:hypothetical protein